MWDVAEYSSAEDMVRAARERRARWSAQAKPDTGINLRPVKPLPVFGIRSPKPDDAAAEKEKQRICAVRALRASNIASLRKIPVMIGTLRARRALRLICAWYKVEPSEFYAPRAKTKTMVSARTLMSKLIHKQGRSTTQIGRIMQRDHSTIVYHLNGKQKRRVKVRPVTSSGSVASGD